MKFGLIVVVAVMLSAFAAHFLFQDPGYVVINFRGYLIETSVPVLIALFLLVVLAGWFLVRLYKAPRQIGQAAGRYRAGRAGDRLTKGIIQIAEGNFARGEKMLARAAGNSDAPLANYLQAARAAHLLGQDERRDNWLRQAYEQMPDASNAVLLTQAEFQLDQGQYESALATLRRIQESAPNHSHALALLGRLYFRLEDWDHLRELLPRLRKHGRLPDDVLAKWATRASVEALNAAADEVAVAERWSATAKNLKTDPETLLAYFRALIRVGETLKAEKELAATLKRQWEGRLVNLYGTIESEDPLKHLKQAESWLGAHPDDPDLLLAAARLCLRNELWGKARSYLETVIGLKPTPEAYQEYGRLLGRMGEGDASADAYRSGLSLVARSPLPAIPHLKTEPREDAEES